MLRRLQKMICLLAVALLVASTMTPAMAKTVKAKVSSSSAKVYKKATRSSKSVKLKKGLTVNVTGVSGSWARIKLNGRTGYMPKKYLSTTSSKSSPPPSRRRAANPGSPRSSR